MTTCRTVLFIIPNDLTFKSGVSSVCLCKLSMQRHAYVCVCVCIIALIGNIKILLQNTVQTTQKVRVDGNYTSALCLKTRV